MITIAKENAHDGKSETHVSGESPAHRDDHIKISKSSVKWVGLVIVAFLIGTAYGTITTMTGMAFAGGIQAPQQPAEEPRAALSLGDAPSLGEDNAPVTIVEFSDFQCPFCQKFHQETLGMIKTNYVDAGKVKFAYKDYPLTVIGHVSADKAAEASRCAGEQGKYWEYHDKLFETQQSDWGYYVQAEGKYLALEKAMPFFKQYAKDLGLDATKFNQCLDSGKYASAVQSDASEGNGAAQQVGQPGLGTPSFFVNGRLVSGAQPYQVFQQIIEEELAA